jgi:hypothetical protein
MATTENFTKAKDHAAEMWSSFSGLHDMQSKMDEMINMEWESKIERKDVKQTISPEPHNQFMGAKRLMSSTQPHINISAELNGPIPKDDIERMEYFCRAVLHQSGRINGQPVNEEIVDSLLRYGISFTSVNDTSDVVDWQKDSLTPPSKARAYRNERLMKTTPFLIKPLNPRMCACELGAMGLEAFYYQSETTVAEMISMYGIREAWKSMKPNEKIKYHEYFDLDVHFSWVEDGAEPLIGAQTDGAHDLQVIPIEVQLGEGSNMSATWENKVHPFLYAIHKGELWERLNLELTVMYTSLFNVASNPTFKFTGADPDETLDIDWSTIGGVIRLQDGQDFRVMERDVFNKDMMQGYSIAEQMVSESGIYKQTLGQPMAAGTAFSSLSLLSQAGRLPLSAPQRASSWTFGAIFENILGRVRDGKAIRTVKGESELLEIKPDIIPENITVSVVVDVDMPQDKLQNANVASMVVDRGLASKEWARESLLNINSPGEMEKDIVKENITNILLQEFATGNMERMITQRVMQQMQQQQQMQQEQMAQQQAQMGGMPPMGGDMGGMPMNPRAMQEAKFAMAKQGEKQNRFADQYNPAMGGMPPIVGKGALPAQSPGQMPVTGEGDFMSPQGGEL